jgi:hypothetical protein
LLPDIFYKHNGVTLFGKNVGADLALQRIANAELMSGKFLRGCIVNISRSEINY